MRERTNIQSWIRRSRSWSTRVLELCLATRSPSGVRPLDTGMTGALSLGLGSGQLASGIGLKAICAAFWGLAADQAGDPCCDRCARSSELRHFIRLFNICLGEGRMGAERGRVRRRVTVAPRSGQRENNRRQAINPKF